MVDAGVYSNTYYIVVFWAFGEIPTLVMEGGTSPTNLFTMISTYII